MRLVDQGHHLFALRMDRDQPLLQSADQFGGIAALSIDTQIAGDHCQHLVARQRRHGKVNSFHRIRQALHQHPAQHGLAGTDFTGDLDHAFAAGDRVNQRFQGFAAVGARKEELGMRGNFERGFGQPEVFQIHRHVGRRLGVLSGISGSILAYSGSGQQSAEDAESSIAVSPPSSCLDATLQAGCKASISRCPAHAPPATYFPAINPGPHRCIATPALSILCPD